MAQSKNLKNFDYLVNQISIITPKIPRLFTSIYMKNFKESR